MSARVLVVDDILPNVKLLEAKLTNEYYDVLTATSGAEAIEKIEHEKPDIVLLDVMMPGMDGFEVCSHIKNNPLCAHIPIVMVTALTDVADKVRGLEAGADDFLSKPINDVALMSRVRSLVRLKMALDEWRIRENTANQLGVVEETSHVMSESVEKANILLIEDRSFEAQKIEQTLETDSHHIVVKDSGVQAMGEIAKQDFDVIIVSINLEHEDGLRLCSHLRSNERTRMVPIIMIGEDQDMKKIAHGLEIGAHDYILRPLERNELLARVRTQVRRKRFQDRLRATYEISLSMALTDGLTGLYNRRYLQVHLQKVLTKNRESNKRTAVLMIDIDHFKSVNDTYGHDVGDQILKVFAQRLRDNLRSFDLVARMGGEEFVVVLPEVSEDRPYMVSERLRMAICNEPIPCNTPEGHLTVTTSIGGAIIKPDDDDTTESALKRADVCLYKAKKDLGRNCSVFEDIGKLDPAQYQPRGRPELEE
ncbi:MAG: PleD family two-component system response regulator [Micavibrio sp.]|nr:PleD family two-component system response regulator [Micavibrio sp.]|tara:strand:+ start:988 stop:2424 length:1437 start_codon:yes stop_codon:yes gene_type:complete